MKKYCLIILMLMGFLCTTQVYGATTNAITFVIKGDVVAALALAIDNDSADLRTGFNLNFDSITDEQIGRIQVLTNNVDGFKLLFESDAATTTASVTYLVRHTGVSYVVGAVSDTLQRMSYQIRLTDVTGGIGAIIGGGAPTLPTAYFTSPNGAPFVLDFDGAGAAGVVNNHVFGIDIELNGGSPDVNLTLGDYQSELDIVLADS